MASEHEEGNDNELSALCEAKAREYINYSNLEAAAYNNNETALCGNIMAASGVVLGVICSMIFSNQNVQLSCCQRCLTIIVFILLIASIIFGIIYYLTTLSFHKKRNEEMAAISKAIQDVTEWNELKPIQRQVEILEQNVNSPILFSVLQLLTFLIAFILLLPMLIFHPL